MKNIRFRHEYGRRRFVPIENDDPTLYESRVDMAYLQARCYMGKYSKQIITKFCEYVKKQSEGHALVTFVYDSRGDNGVMAHIGFMSYKGDTMKEMRSFIKKIAQKSDAFFVNASRISVSNYKGEALYSEFGLIAEDEWQKMREIYVKEHTTPL